MKKGTITFTPTAKKYFVATVSSVVALILISHILMTHHQMDFVRLDGETCFASTTEKNDHGRPAILQRKANQVLPEHYF
jgi:hypothetical protein